MYVICAYIHVWENNFFLWETLAFLSLSHIHLEQSYLLDLEILHFSHELRFLLRSPHPYIGLFFGAYIPTLMFWSAKFLRDKLCNSVSEQKGMLSWREVISLIYSYRSNSNSKTLQTSISVTCPGTSMLAHAHIHIYCMTYNASILHILFLISLFTAQYLINISLYNYISSKYFRGYVILHCMNT